MKQIFYISLWYNKSRPGGFSVGLVYLTRAEEKTDDPLLTEEMLGDREDWADRWKCISDQIENISNWRSAEERGCWVNSAKKQVGNESKKIIYNTTRGQDQTFCRLYLERDSV